MGESVGSVKMVSAAADAPTVTTSTTRTIRLRYPGTCTRCGASIAAGTDAVWDSSARTVSCIVCPQPADPWQAVAAPPSSGIAGRSAQAEGDSRLAGREARIRKRFPRLGGLILVVFDPPQTTTSWGKGAEGERKVAARLAKPEAAGAIVVLHDRRVPGSKGNIDHLVVGPAGVYVIDTKRYASKKIEKRAGRLFIGGRDKSNLVAAMARQVDTVRRVLDRLDEALEVFPTLCFVDGDWGLFGPYGIDGVQVTWPRQLEKQVTRPGSLDRDARIVIAHHLAAGLPEA